MSRKSWKRLGNTLLITDINQNFIKDCKSWPVGNRQQQTAHCHGTEQTQGFKCNCFTACVRTCDYERVILLTQDNVSRHNLVFINKGMTCFFQLNYTFIIQERFCCFHFIGKMSLGKNQIQHNSTVKRMLDTLSKLPCLGRKLKKYTHNLITLFALQNLDIIVGIHNRGRLNKHSCTCWRCIVNKTRNITPVLCLNRHNKAAVTLRNNSLLQVWLIVGGMEHSVKLFTDWAFLWPDFSSYVWQKLTGFIGYFLLTDNWDEYLCFKVFIRGNTLKEKIKICSYTAAVTMPLIKGTDWP